MSNPSGSSGNFIASILDFLLRLLGASKPVPPPAPTPPQPVIPPDNNTEPVRIITSRVLYVIYNPIVDAAAGTKLTELMHWNDPDTLANTFIQDILDASSGNARYQIAQRVELNEFPAKADGFRYDLKSYLNVVKGGQAAYQPDLIDYTPILTGLNILPRIAQRDIDEVWLMGFPWAGFHESVMGGSGAFWCNADPLDETAGYPRKFVIMGFSYSREADMMLHSFAHRVESIMEQAFHCPRFISDWVYNANRLPATMEANPNLFKQFISFDLVAPGKAGLGAVHFPPNAAKEGDYRNPRKVMSTCYDWHNFPNFQNDVREVSADEWGNGDLHTLHKWWLSHLPKVAGRTGGVANNWWQYILDPNLVNL